MARKEWEDMVDKEILFDGPDPLGAYMERDDVVELLARQHAGFVRRVKTVKHTGKHPVSKIHETPQWMEGYFQACNDLLAALGAGAGIVSDPRAVAKYSPGLRDGRMVPCGNGGWVKYDDHSTALADAERRVWKEAAKDCRDQSRVYAGGELMKRHILVNMAEFFESKAQAGEGR